MEKAARVQVAGPWPQEVGHADGYTLKMNTKPFPLKCILVNLLWNALRDFSEHQYKMFSLGPSL